MRQQALDFLGHARGVVRCGTANALHHVHAVTRLVTYCAVVLRASEMGPLLCHLCQLQALGTPDEQPHSFRSDTSMDRYAAHCANCLTHERGLYHLCQLQVLCKLDCWCSPGLLMQAPHILSGKSCLDQCFLDLKTYSAHDAIVA